MSIKQKISLALATCGVGYLPLAPGTWGSALAVVGYFGYQRLLELGITDQRLWAPLTAVLLTAFCVLGIKASKIAADAMGRKIPVKSWSMK